jgi:ELWxxDGT repeat protein
VLALRHRAAAVALIALSSLLPAASTHAQAPVLVKDLVTGTAASDPQDLVVVGSTLFFSANDGAAGRELWKSDGTEAGTALVKDVRSGGLDSGPANLTSVGPVLFFTADDGIHGRELWKSDGTATGTVLVADLSPSEFGSDLTSLTAVGGTLYFVGSVYGVGSGLWRSDGTAAGTVLLRLLSCAFPRDGACANTLTDVNGTLFFAAASSAGWELWKSNGTTAGTAMVSDICPGSCNSIGYVIPKLTHVDGTLYFQADDGTRGRELWRSDGTIAGTVLVKDIIAGSSGSWPDQVVAVNSRVYFRASDLALGSELWTSDGTGGGTVLVKDMNPGSASSLPTALVSVGGVLYFTAVSPTSGGAGLWRSDGTAAGTVLVRAATGGHSFTNIAGTLMFGYDGELWRSDGTTAGTVQVKDIRPGSTRSSPLGLTSIGGTLLFSADDGTAGRELWRSDGTAAGTWRVKDVNARGAGAGLGWLTNVNGRLFFTANGSDVGVGPDTGVELWSSDGTAAGTAIVGDLYGDSSPYSLVGANGAVFFLREDPDLYGYYVLWRSDGRSLTAVWSSQEDPAEGLPGSLRRFGTDVVFRADGTQSGRMKLWKSDGTAAGTTVLEAFGSASVRDLRNVGGTQFFTVGGLFSDSVSLWKKDSATTGAVQLKAGWTYDSGPWLLTDVQGTPFFVAGGAADAELWTSDGTPAGTVLVKDIRAGAGSEPRGLTNVDGIVYFTADDGVHGRELWRSDGTAAGTILVKDIRPGAGGSEIEGPPIHVNGRLFFFANDGATGRELWTSDGTAAGTVLVRDIRPGTEGSFPLPEFGPLMADVDGVLYFPTDDGATGLELWRSDGTPGGTTRVADLRPGPAGSRPSDLTNVNGTLYFVADNGPSGRELWKLEGPPSVPSLRAGPPALNVGGRATISGRNFTPGAVVKLFVATAAGPVGYGPYVPMSWSPTALGVVLPADVPLGNGFAAVQVINADAGYRESNVVPALLVGEAGAGVPTITQINGVGLGPAALSIGVAHIDTVVGKGATVTIGGTGFADPVVSVFTATGKVDLVPTAWTATSVSVVLPLGVPTGPGTFRVVNRPSYRESNAVASVIGAVPTIASVVAAGGTVTVTGTGFCSLSVINLYNLQGGVAVNLGGLGPGGTAKVPLTLVNDTQFTFARPAGAVAGPAFVEVLNPPFIPYASSRSDPDGAFTMPAAVPLWTEDLPSRLKPRDAGRDDVAAVADDGDEGLDQDGHAAAAGDGSRGRATRERVRWAHPVGAHAAGDVLTASPSPRRAAVSTTSPRRAALSGRPGAGARSTRALLAGDGSVSWTVRADAGDVAFGFGDSDRDGSLADLAFAWRLNPATRELRVYERGVRQAALGTYAPGDRLRIAVRGGVVEYRRNGALVFTSTTAPTYPLVVDASLGSPDATLRGVRLAGRLGTVIDWTAAPGVTTSSMAVAADGGRGVVASAGAGGGALPDTTDADRPGVGAVDRAGTGAGGRAATGGRPYTVGGECDPVVGCAVVADLRGAAGIGFGATACDYCIVRVDDRTVQVRHAGAVRGTWSAPAGVRVRVEIGADGVARYLAGEVQLDQAPLEHSADSVLVPTPAANAHGWLGARAAAIVGATRSK